MYILKEITIQRLKYFLLDKAQTSGGLGEKSKLHRVEEDNLTMINLLLQDWKSDESAGVNTCVLTTYKDTEQLVTPHALVFIKLSLYYSTKNRFNLYSGLTKYSAWPHRRHYLSKKQKFRKTIFTKDFKRGKVSLRFLNKKSQFSPFKMKNNHKVWFSYWKSQTFGKSLKTFGSRIFSWDF